MTTGDGHAPPSRGAQVALFAVAAVGLALLVPAAALLVAGGVAVAAHRLGARGLRNATVAAIAAYLVLLLVAYPA